MFTIDNIIIFIIIISFPGVEKRVTLAYAREKIKARRKSALKKHLTHETIETMCEPLQFVEFWGDDRNPITQDDCTEDIIYSEDEDLKEKIKDSDQVYSDEQGYKYSIVSVQNKTRYNLKLNISKIPFNNTKTYKLWIHIMNDWIGGRIWYYYML